MILPTEPCVLRTFGGVDFSLVFICVQSVSEFLWDRLRASIQFPVMPKRAQYARFSGEYRYRYFYSVHGRLVRNSARASAAAAARRLAAASSAHCGRLGARARLSAADRSIEVAPSE
eukprot:COSAG02_NODE_821_length_16794_cov_42.795747_5_plen_117_part_00